MPGFLNFLGCLHNFQGEIIYISFPLAHAQRNESKKEVETGYFMFRLYLLKYLFVEEWGTEITDILMPKTLRW